MYKIARGQEASDGFGGRGELFGLADTKMGRGHSRSPDRRKIRLMAGGALLKRMADDSTKLSWEKKKNGSQQKKERGGGSNYGGLGWGGTLGGGGW